MTSRAVQAKSDAQFEQLLAELEFHVSETDLTPARREARRKRADACDLAFCEIYFPGIFDSPFNRLHRHVAGLKSGIHPVGGHRRSGKSAIAYFGKAVKRMALGNGGLIALGLRTQEKAEERTKALVRVMQRNRLLCYDYDLTVDQDKAGWHIVNNTHLVAVSYKTGLRSIMDDEMKRIRLFIGDDLYDRTTVSSELDNDRVVEFITSEVHGQMEDDGLAIVYGNHIVESCPIIRLQALFPETAYNMPALDEEGRSCWPERFGEEYWKEFQARTAYDVWMSEYMLTPVLKGEIFDRDWFRFVSLNLVQILATIGTIDPSHGQSPEACFKSLWTVGVTSSRELVGLDVYLRKEPYGDFFEYAFTVLARFPHYRALLFENDFGQWNIARPYYADWQTSAGGVRHLPLVTYSAKELVTDRGTDKDSRIMNLVHPHQTGALRYSQEIQDHPDFVRHVHQLLSFGKAGGKLDGPDALAAAFILIWRYVESGGFKSLKTRSWKKPKWMRGGWR